MLYSSHCFEESRVSSTSEQDRLGKKRCCSSLISWSMTEFIPFNKIINRSFLNVNKIHILLRENTHCPIFAYFFGIPYGINHSCADAATDLCRGYQILPDILPSPGYFPGLNLLHTVIISSANDGQTMKLRCRMVTARIAGRLPGRALFNRIAR